MKVTHHNPSVPTYIFSIPLGIPKKYKQKCIKELYNLGDYQGNKTNVQGIMSSYYIWQDSNVFNLLLNNIFKVINTTVPIIDKRFEYHLNSCWGAIYKKGHFCKPHQHVPAQVSFVYYLQSPPNSSPLIFDDIPDFKLNLVDDLLVVFPSYLTHSVPQHTEKIDRISFAGNFDWRPIL